MNEWMLDTIKAKSDQLNACDLVGGPAVITIKGVRQTRDEQPMVIEIEGRQPYKPCKNMRRVLINCWGIEKGWVGRSLRVYCDPEATFGKEKVGGIRISHLSHISGPMDTPVMWTRGKSSMWRVEPLAVEPTATVEDRIAKVLSAINAAKNADDLATVMRKAKQLYDTLTIEQQAVIDNAKLAKGF